MNAGYVVSTEKRVSVHVVTVANAAFLVNAVNGVSAVIMRRYRVSVVTAVHECSVLSDAVYSEV